MAELREYGSTEKIYFPLVTYGGSDYLSGATIAAGDCKFMIDGDSDEFVATDATFEEEGGGIYSITPIAAEMQGKVIIFRIVDQTATQEWEQQMIIVETYGHASAMHAFNLNTAVPEVNLTQIDGETTDDNNAILYLKALDIKSTTGGVVPLSVRADGAATTAINIKSTLDSAITLASHASHDDVTGPTDDELTFNINIEGLAAAAIADVDGAITANTLIVAIKDIVEGDWVTDISDPAQWQLIIYKKNTTEVLLTKDLSDVNGDPIISSAVPIGRGEEA